MSETEYLVFPPNQFIDGLTIQQGEVKLEEVEVWFTSIEVLMFELTFNIKRIDPASCHGKFMTVFVSKPLHEYKSHKYTLEGDS